MARSAKVLSERAHQLCLYQRHEMHRFKFYNEYLKVSYCKKCEKVAILVLHPREGELDIKGNAPYSYCMGRPMP